MYSLCGSCRSFSWDCFNKISTLFWFSCKGRLFDLSQSEFVSCWYVRVRLVVSSNKPRLNMWSDNLLIRRELVRTAICSRKHLMHVRLAPSLSISSTAFLNFNHIYLFFFFFFFFWDRCLSSLVVGTGILLRIARGSVVLANSLAIPPLVVRFLASSHGNWFYSWTAYEFNHFLNNMDSGWFSMRTYSISNICCWN